jgi:predicted transcriptional regulator of viral defense system
MDNLLNKINIPYLTTSYLVDLFSKQKHPRDKIKNLKALGDLIHLKQGLYLLGEKYRRSYSKEVLAGMIYGPSAISFEYALSYHGLIPERVEVITSICFKRNKKFSTPIGDFTYRYVPQELYSLGIDYIQTEEGNFFIAGPEKALCDLAYNAKITSDEEALDFVIGSLRVDENEVRKLNAPLLLELGKTYRRRSTVHMVDALIIFQNKRRT